MMPAILKSPRLWITAGALVCGTGVALGAYGWHALKGDADASDIFMLAVQYQMWHGLALFLIAWRSCSAGKAAILTTLAGLCFTAGIFLFSGNLYYFAVTGVLLIAGAAPMGGFAFMLGWLLIAASVFPKCQENQGGNQT